MAPRSLPDHWTEDAGWLVQALDPRARLVRLVRLDEAGYRAASFLDDRMLATPHDALLCRLDDVVHEGKSLARADARWIFHIGHVGSTLVARLLGELDGVLSVREPRALRDLVFVDPSERSEIAGALRGLMARTFVPGQHALVKATSFVSELAPLLVGESSLALFLFATPANYVASILAGENSVKELAALRETRLARLAERGIVLTGLDRGEAQWAAAAWACEMVSLEAASDQIGEARILWADFDRMLTDMAAWLGRCAGHLGLAADPDRLAGIVGGPLMGRYSKALEYDYSPALRAELLGEATRHHRAAIVDALGLLRRNAETIPLLARALRRAEPEFQNVSHPATADRR